MCFQLVYGDFEHSLRLPLDAGTEAKLLSLVTDGGNNDKGGLNGLNLSRQIADLVTALVEIEGQAPTSRQKKYAEAIAKELAVEIPLQALRYRSAMAVFLSHHAEPYRQSKGALSR